jgi:glycosyltransferase involved in cell wall biosynthesis
MNIAIVNDSLFEFGGAERVLLEVLKIFPDAHVYTSVASPSIVKQYFKNTIIHVLPIPQKFFSQHTSLFQAFSPLLWRLFNFNKHNLVIAISGHMMSNFVNPGRALFIQYLLTVPKNVYFLEPKTNLQKIFPYHTYTRPLYEHALRKNSCLLTLSHHMQTTFRTMFGVTPEVIYPPVRIPKRLSKRNRGTYYLVVSRLDRSKSIELAIKACNRLKEQLVIVGETNEWTYEQYLRRIAGPTIRFAGFQPDERMEKYYTHAKAFLFTPKNEDFGIAPVEAMAHGVPVIAYYGGGAKETVADGKTGIFFHSHSVESLVGAMKKLQSRTFNSTLLRKHAEMFSENQFQDNFSEYISRVISAEAPR